MDTPPPPDDPHHDLTTYLLQDGIVTVNGDLLLGLRPVDAERAGDRFDPFRCGLDHLSFAICRPGCAGGGGADLPGTRRGTQRHHQPAAVRDRGPTVQGSRRYGAGAYISAVADRDRDRANRRRDKPVPIRQRKRRDDSM